MQPSRPPFPVRKLKIPLELWYAAADIARAKKPALPVTTFCLDAIREKIARER